MLILVFLIACTSAQNLTYKTESPGLTFGEGALGGLIPSSIIILLAALIPILQLYKQRRRENI